MGPKGINWTEAFKFFCETLDGKLPSYNDVALKFEVSKTEVGQKALSENWLRLRQELYENGKSKFLENKSNLIAEVEEKELKRWRDVQSLADKCLNEIESVLSLKVVGKLSTLVRVYKVAIEGERTLLGLPNNILSSSLKVGKDNAPKLPPELVREIDSLFELNGVNNQAVVS